MKKKYRTEFTRGGEVLDYFDKYSNALTTIRTFEKEDKEAGVFKPGIYTISRWNGMMYVPIYVSSHNGKHRSKKSRTKKTEKAAPFGL